MARMGRKMGRPADASSNYSNIKSLPITLCGYHLRRAALGLVITAVITTVITAGSVITNAASPKTGAAVSDVTATTAAITASTATLTLTIRVPELLTITLTCATPDPSGDGSCDIPNTAPVGTAVASFAINGAPAPYTGTPTFTEATGSFKMSGKTIMTAVTPLTALSYSATVSGAQ